MSRLTGNLQERSFRQAKFKHELLQKPEPNRVAYYSKNSIGNYIPENQNYIEDLVRAEVQQMGISGRNTVHDAKYDTGLPTYNTARRYVQNHGISAGVYDRNSDTILTTIASEPKQEGFNIFPTSGSCQRKETYEQLVRKVHFYEDLSMFAIIGLIAFFLTRKGSKKS